MITFPGLNFNFNITPVAFSIFGINIYWYAICLVFAIAISVILCCRLKPKFDIKDSFLFESFLYAIAFGIIGARIYYVLFNFDYYLSNPLNIFKLRDGGLAIYGGIIGGAITFFYRCKKNNVSCLDIFDRVAPFIALRAINRQMGEFF